MNKNEPRITKMKISDIFVDEESNARDLDDERFKKLRESLNTFGNLQPIVVNEATNKLVGGHQRLKILSETSDEVDVWLVNLDEFQEQSASLALNNEVGEFDDNALSEIIKGFDSEQVYLTGFDDNLIEQITTELDDSLEQGTEELSEKMEIYKITLDFESLESKFRFESFIEQCKLHAGHNRPITDHMFELIDNDKNNE
jgi:ParB-like chromosome segregation protein Spo0J